MPAAILPGSGGEIAVSDVPEPAPGIGQVLMAAVEA